MALQIKSTPVLTGKAAERFYRKMDEVIPHSINFSEEVAIARKILEKSKIKDFPGL